MAEDNKDRISKEALKAAEDFIKKTEQGKKNVEGIQEAFSKVATELFGISGAAFFKEIPKTTKELETQRKKISEIKNELDKSFKDIGDSLKKQFNSALRELEKGPSTFNTSALDGIAKKYGIETFSDINDLQKQINEKFEKHADKLSEFKQDREKFIKSEKDYYKGTEDFYKKILEDNTELFAGFSDQERLQKIQQIHQSGFNKLVAEGSDIIKDMALHSDGVDDSIKQAAVDALDLKDKLSESTKELDSANKKVFSLSNGLQGVVKNFSGGILPSIKEANQAFKDAQKDFGMSFDGAYTQMAGLTSEAARFGMSTKDTVQMMGQLGDELKTTDTKYLASATEHFIAIQKATGISSEEVTTIAGEMMRAGKSAEEVEGFMDQSNKIAKKFGVNTKKIMQGVAKNIDKMRQMGFQGGEESLARMAARAERLNMNMDEMFDVAKKARNIEGAMEMASDLQLAGGSFANIDPMSLLAAARKGPEELQKILTQMGGDIGTFNKETGELKFDAIDADRLQMVADATGQTVDSIQKGLQKAAADNAKLDVLGLDSSIGEDAKNFLSDMTTMKDGQLSVSPELSDLASGAGIDISNVDDLKSLSQEETAKLMAAKADKEKSLEDQALANQSFQESIEAFKSSIMSLFTVFQPLLDVLTGFIQSLSEFGPIGKGLAAALIGMVAFGPKLVEGFKSFKSMAEGGKGMIDKLRGKGSDMASSAPAPGKSSIPGQDSKDVTPGKGGGGLQSLAEGLKAMGDPKVFAGIGATALAAPALVLMLAGIPTIMLMAAVGAMGKLVEAGFKAVANGISAMGEAKGVLKGALAMFIIGAAMLPFAFALQMMAEVEWSTIGMMVVGIVALAGVVALLGFIAPLMLVGALALAAASVGLLIFGAAIMVFAGASEMMQGMSFDWLGSLGWNLLTAAPGLLLGGLSLLIAAPALMIGGIALMAFAVAAQSISSVDWTAFSAMGSALTAVVPGMLGFALAGLMFVNPITLLGMVMMMGTLGGLAMVMIPLGAAMTMAADGIDRFADGLAKLQAVAATLDFERLEALKDLSMSMAVGSSGGGLGDSINKIAEALAKLTAASTGGAGSKGGSGNKKIEINLKLNGRDLQSIIVDDTSIVS